MYCTETAGNRNAGGALALTTTEGAESGSHSLQGYSNADTTFCARNFVAWCPRYSTQLAPMLSSFIRTSVRRSLAHNTRSLRELSHRWRSAMYSTRLVCTDQEAELEQADGHNHQKRTHAAVSLKCCTAVFDTGSRPTTGLLLL